MTRTDYAWRMSGTPSDPGYINTKALERFVRHFDHVVWGKNDIESGAVPPKVVDWELGDPFLRVADHALSGTIHSVAPKATKVPIKSKASGPWRLPKSPRASFWYTFPLFKIIHRFRDNIRLRMYNRQ